MTGADRGIAEQRWRSSRPELKWRVPRNPFDSPNHLVRPISKDGATTWDVLLARGVTVAHQVLVLIVKVRILAGQLFTCFVMKLARPPRMFLVPAVRL